MRSAGVKIAVGTMVVLAAVAGIFFWTGARSGVALAEVLAKMEQIQAFTYKATMHVTGSAPEVPSGGKDMEMSMLVANEYGMKMEMSSTDPNSGRAHTVQTYWLPHQRMAMTVMPEMKMYMRMELDDSMFEAMRKENNDPRVMVRQILDGKYEELGKSVIDGVEVEGFRTTDPAYTRSGLGDGNVTVWAGIKSGLPVRVDIKMKEQMWMGMGTEMEGTMHDFQWDVPVSAAEFTPTIPADFTPGPGDGVKMPALTEETALRGLKLCHELTGKYPDDLNLMTLAQVATEGFKSERTATPRQEPPQPPDLTPSLEKSRFRMPPQHPGRTAPREEVEKWLEEMKKWREDEEKALAEDKKRMDELNQWRKDVEKWRENQKELPKTREELLATINDDIKKMADKMMPVQMLGVFYMHLVGENKEPAYYGKAVKPGDIAQVLMRWKVGANEYRVIFADLHAETVKADTLAKLEAAMPK